MGKGKLAKFADMASYPHVFECPMGRAEGRWDNSQFSIFNFQLRGRWRSDLFHNDNPIVLELGCGRGEYTVGLARRYPDRNFIGGGNRWR